MVVDYIKNYQQYKNTLNLLEEAFEYAKNCTADMTDGRYELSEGMYASVMSGETTPLTEGLFETHKQYIDLQYVIEGEELLETNDVSALTLKIPYDASKDASFFDGNGQVLSIKKGMFYLMFPNDAHKGCKHEKQPTKYKKIVIKIPL